jgi:uncharacterized membrane protein (UPF0127 family)
MKKNKYHQKLTEKVVKTSQNKFLSAAILIAFFLVGMYGYRCLLEKVCEVESIDKFVRHDMMLAMPRGTMTVEVADTKSSRELGLSGRKEMKADEGLLFAFDTPGRYGFWMKDMTFPLDIIWITQNGVVVEVERNVKPESYPKTFINASPASFVLELQAGMAEKQGVYIGSKIKMFK